MSSAQFPVPGFVNQFFSSRWLYPLLIVIVCIFAGFFFAQRINLTTADLGRHIKNGEIFYTTWQIVDTNYYSYTQPQYPTTNHHWLTGPLFYLVWKESGFYGLSLIFIGLCLITYLLFIKIASRTAPLPIVIVTSLLVLPLVASRREVRPEVFSYLFSGLFLYLLSGDLLKKKYIRTLFILVLLQIIWVNMHILFVLGICITGAFFLRSLIFHNTSVGICKYIILLSLLVMACFINPFGLTGALAPFMIFKSYGYMLAENQSVLFMQQRFPEVLYLYTEALVVVVIGLTLYVRYRKRPLKDYFLSLLLVIVFMVMGIKMIRNLPLFGLFLIPFVSESMTYILETFSSINRERIQKGMIGAAFMIVVAGFIFPGNILSPFNGNTGLGLMPKADTSARFFYQ